MVSPKSTSTATALHLKGNRCSSEPLEDSGCNLELHCFAASVLSFSSGSHVGSSFFGIVAVFEALPVLHIGFLDYTLFKDGEIADLLARNAELTAQLGKSCGNTLWLSGIPSLYTLWKENAGSPTVDTSSVYNMNSSHQHRRAA